MKKILLVTRLALFAFLLLSTPVYSGETINGNSFNKQLLKTKAYDPSGTWNIEIETPGGTEEGIIVISKNDKGEFEVTLEDRSQNDQVELEEVSFDEEDMKLTGEADVDGMTLELELEFDDNSMEGKASAQGMEMKLTGERETD